MKSSRTWRCLQSARELGLGSMAARPGRNDPGRPSHEQEQWEAHVACSCLRSSNPRTSHTDRPANSSRQRTSNEHHEFPGRLLLAWRSLDGLARPQRRLFCNPRVASSWLHSHQPYLKVSSKRARSLSTLRQGSPASSKARQQTCMARPHAPSHHSDRPVSVRLRTHQQSTRQGRTSATGHACFQHPFCLSWLPARRAPLRQKTHGSGLGCSFFSRSLAPWRKGGDHVETGPRSGKAEEACCESVAT